MWSLSCGTVGSFVGDELTDIPVLERVGFSATVADGAEEVKQRVHYVARAKGGEGGGSRNL